MCNPTCLPQGARGMPAGCCRPVPRLRRDRAQRAPHCRRRAGGARSPLAGDAKTALAGAAGCRCPGRRRRQHGLLRPEACAATGAAGGGCQYQHQRSYHPTWYPTGWRWPGCGHGDESSNPHRLAGLGLLPRQEGRVRVRVTLLHCRSTLRDISPLTSRPRAVLYGTYAVLLHNKLASMSSSPLSARALVCWRCQPLVCPSLVRPAAMLRPSATFSCWRIWQCFGYGATQNPAQLEHVPPPFGWPAAF